MKKQAYAIEKHDWMLSVKSGGHTFYSYHETKKEALCRAKRFYGVAQLFKVSFEFKDVMVRERKKK